MADGAQVGQREARSEVRGPVGAVQVLPRDHDQLVHEIPSASDEGPLDPDVVGLGDADHTCGAAVPRDEVDRDIHIRPSY